MSRKRKIIIAIIIIITLAVDIYCLTSKAEEYVDAWILCHVNSCVLVREQPHKNGYEFGELECCDHIYTDGVVKNGYLHCVDMATESGDGWISNAYVVYDEPYKPKYNERQIITTTRVAARQRMNGKIKKWLYNGDNINVYAISNNWCVTNVGYVKTEFIDTGSYVKEQFNDTSEEMTYEDDE